MGTLLLHQIATKHSKGIGEYFWDGLYNCKEINFFTVDPQPNYLATASQPLSTHYRFVASGLELKNKG